jgi:very-short-patch-repair endonuclease
LNSTAISSLVCAVSLLIFAVVGLMYAFRRIFPSTKDVPRMPPSNASESAPAPASSRISLRPPSRALPPVASLTPTERPASNLPYERIPTLLSAAERDFFAALQQAAPAGHRIFGQVRLANLVQVKQSARRDKSHWWRIQAKCLDFVLVDSASFAPRLVIELDDRSHARADRRERDAFVDDVLASAGIPILHVRWQRSYDTQALAQQIATVLSVAMPSNSALAPPVAVGLATAAGSHTAVPIHQPSPPQPTPIRHVCGQCQAELREAAKFCSQCGAVFSVAP